jgi:hypothetical protein
VFYNEFQDKKDGFCRPFLFGGAGIFPWVTDVSAALRIAIWLRSGSISYEWGQACYSYMNG